MEDDSTMELDQLQANQSSYPDGSQHRGSEVKAKARVKNRAHLSSQGVRSRGAEQQGDNDDVDLEHIRLRSQNRHRFEASSRNTFPEGIAAGAGSPEIPPPTLRGTGPVKHFKRPRSYIHGRHITRTGDLTMGSDCSEGAKESCESVPTWASRSEKYSKFVGRRSHADKLTADNLTQEEKEQAALSRLNYLNMKLKGHQSATGSPKTDQNQKCYDFAVEPDPPSWSYESYSDCERRENKLPGLRSYIRTNEGKLGVSGEGREPDEDSTCAAPPESLVAYLDGVLTPRFTVRKCSMRVNHFSDQEEDHTVSEPVCHKRRGHKRRPSKHRKGKYHSKRGSPRRPSSAERVRRLEIGMVEDTYPNDSVAEDRTVSSEDTSVDLKGEQRSRLGKRGPALSGYPHSGGVAGVGSQGKVKEFSKSPVRRYKNSYPNNTLKVRKYGFSKRTNEISPASDAMHRVSKKGHRYKSGQGLTESNIDCGSHILSNLVDTDGFNLPIPVRNSGPPELSSQQDETGVLDFEPTRTPPSRVSPPVLQIQESPLAVDDGYIMSGVSDRDSSDYLLEDADQERRPKRRRLVVRKDKASARIWTRSKILQTSGKQSFHSHSPYGDNSVEENDEDDENEDDAGDDNDHNDDDDEEEDGVNGEDIIERDHGRKYGDLIIQTELSEGSKVRLSTSDGPIADIQNGSATESDITQFQIMKYKPDSREIDILSKHVLADAKGDRLYNKSQNNERREKSYSSSNDSSMSSSTNRQGFSKKVKSKRKQKTVNIKRHSPLSPKTQQQMVSNSPMFNHRPKHPYKSAEGKRASTPRSPPKPTPTLSPAHRHSGKSSSTQRKEDGLQRTSPSVRDDRPEETNDFDELEIPMCNDGTTRVLLVLRTPPKRSGEGNRVRENGARRSLERKVRSASPNRMSPDRSPTDGKDKIKSPSFKTTHSHEQSGVAKDSRTRFGDLGFIESQRHPSMIDGRMTLPRYVNDSSTANFQPTGRGRRQSQKYKFESMLPKACGQESDGQFTLDHAEQMESETIRKLVVGPPLDNTSGEDASPEYKVTVETFGTGGGDTIRADMIGGSSPSHQDPAETHGPCKFSRYQPCQHDAAALQRNVVSTAAKSEKHSLGQSKTRSKRSNDVKNLVTDHGPCAYDRFQPCSHVAHSPCQFGRFEPCRHEECEKPVPLKDFGAGSNFYSRTPKHVNSRKAPEASECKFDRYRPCQHDECEESSSSTLMRLLSPRPNPTGYKYNSKTLQSKLGVHSPCVFDRYKPCLHEECLGPHGNTKNLTGVSLLSHASKSNAKNDPKSKMKDINPNTGMCKFNRYTPCFHGEEIKFSRAFGRKASLRPEKSKIRHPDMVAEGSPEAIDPCKFNRFMPCFCQETVKSLKIDRNQISGTTNAVALSQRSQRYGIRFMRKSTDKAASKAKTEGVDSALCLEETGKEKKGSSVLCVKNKERAEKHASTTQAKQIADEPNVKIRVHPTPPNATNAIGAGDAEVLKPDEGEEKAEDEAAQSGGLSLISRISRAWFSSAQAQVARLAPPQRIMVPPTLRPDKPLGCNAGVDSFVGMSQEQAGAKLDKPTVSAITAAAASCDALQQHQSVSPPKYSALSSDEQTTCPNKTFVQTAKTKHGRGEAFVEQGVYELSLADSKNVESFDIDTSQKTELLEPSDWTLSRARPGKQRLSESDVDMLSVTETCCEQTEAIRQFPASRQLWRAGGVIPENFLVLTSNLYPVATEFGDSDAPGETSKLVDSSVEVLSADPLPVHFSDIARASRINDSSRRQLLKDQEENLSGGESGFTLCNSLQNSRQWVRDHRGSDKVHVQVIPRSLDIFGQTQHFTDADTPVNVNTLLKKNSALANNEWGDRNSHADEIKSQEECDAGVEFTTCGDKYADPLSHHRHPHLNRHSQRNVSVYGCCSTVAGDQQLGKDKEIIYGVRDCAYSIERKEHETKVNDILGHCQNKTTWRDFEDTASSPQAMADGENGSAADLSSEEKQAAVVAAAELASYKSLLDTITKIARVGSSLGTVITDGEAPRASQGDDGDEVEACRRSITASASDSQSSGGGCNRNVYTTGEESDDEEEDSSDGHGDSDEDDGDDDDGGGGGDGYGDEDEDDNICGEEPCDKPPARTRICWMERKGQRTSESTSGSSVEVGGRTNQERPNRALTKTDKVSPKALGGDQHLCTRGDGEVLCDESAHNPEEKRKTSRYMSSDAQEPTDAGRHLEQHGTRATIRAVRTSRRKENCDDSRRPVVISDTSPANFVTDHCKLARCGRGAGAVQNVCPAVGAESGLEEEGSTTSDSSSDTDRQGLDESLEAGNREKTEDGARCGGEKFLTEEKDEDSEDSDEEGSASDEDESLSEEREETDETDEEEDEDEHRDGENQEEQEEKEEEEKQERVGQDLFF